MDENRVDNRKIEFIPKSELKPGQTLYDEIPGMPGLKSGYVISQTDIDKIMKNAAISEVKVFLKPKKEAEAQSLSAPAPVGYHPSSSDDLESLKLSDQEREYSILSPEAAKQVKTVVQIKKNIIRGTDYIERYEGHKQSKLKSFHSAMKGIQPYQKEETLKAIDDYARSSADFEGIESISSAQTPEMVERIDRYEKNATHFYDAALGEQTVYTPFIEEIVIDFINDMGYELARGLFSSLSKIEQYTDFYIAHSLQVMIVSLVTAIELTKMVREKTDTSHPSDINFFLAVSKKFFSLEDLVNLGLAALLHDIEIKRKRPELGVSAEIGIEWDSLQDVHMTNGYHYCKKLEADYEVQRAVYQHHERTDGSGSPNGITARFFSKYSPILSFAEHYVEMTTPNPFAKSLIPPRNALVNILSHERYLFDGDVVYAFIRAASMFPVGSWLLLDNGHIGIVFDINRDLLERPIMLTVFDKNLKKIKPKIENLAESESKIVKPIDLNSIRKIAGETLNFIYNFWKA